jgi:hypothetical protein
LSRTPRTLKRASPVPEAPELSFDPVQPSLSSWLTRKLIVLPVSPPHIGNCANARNSHAQKSLRGILGERYRAFQEGPCGAAETCSQGDVEAF